MKLRTLGITAVGIGFVGAVFVLGGAVLGDGSAPTLAANGSTPTPRVTSTPYIPDDSYLLTPGPVNPDDKTSEPEDNEGETVSLPNTQPSVLQGGETAQPAPVLQPQPEAPQAPQPEPETEVGQPEPPVVVELVNAAPSVVAATPSDGQIGVGLSPKVQVTFSEPMDKASVEAAFQMVAPVMAGTFSWNSDATVMTFDPSVNFTYGTNVQWKVAKTAADASGKPMDADFTSTFRVLRQSTKVLQSISAKDGFVYGPGVAVLGSHANATGGSFKVGTWERGFLSFDLSSLPSDLVEITGAEVSIYQSAHHAGAYSPTTGSLWVESAQYGSLDAGDFAMPAVQICLPGCAPVSYQLSAASQDGWKGAGVLVLVKRDWQNREAQGFLSQLRLRFQHENNGAGPDVSATFNAGEAGSNQPVLEVTYTHP
jgi:hypothetical protein